MAQTTWSIDPSHSDVQFKVKHLVISTVTGNFANFTGTVVAEDENFENASVNFEADINSISTGNEQRDGHLKSDDFFSADKFPKLTFKSTSLKKVSNEVFKISGDLTIRDVTKTVDLDVEFGGIMKDPYGNIKAGFAVAGKINRKDFGLAWSAVTEAGGVVVSDEVRLIADVQFVKGN